MAAAKLMHAVHYDCYGGGASGLKHVEVPIPTPKKNEVLLKLEAASLNPGDCKIQKGMARPCIPRKLPHIPVTDVAGEVVEVGQEVTKFKVGDKVVAMLSYRASAHKFAPFSLDAGGFGEFATANEKSVAIRPPGVSAADAAGLPCAALTAHQALTKDAKLKLDGTSKQTNILVTGASGNVGLYAIQLAKLANAHVTVTCGTRNVELCKSLGADEVLDYMTPEGAAVKSPSGRKYDFMIHSSSKAIPWSVFAPNLCSTAKVIDLTANLASLITFVVKKITFSKKTLVPLIVKADGEGLDCLAKLVKEGKLKTVIDSTFPLSKAEDAWAKRFEGKNTGKIIVEH